MYIYISAVINKYGKVTPTISILSTTGSKDSKGSS